jgi:hypothetical protein
MGRPISGARWTCESCRSLDIRQLHRRNLLRAGLRFGWEWRHEAGRAADIQIRTEDDAIVLVYRVRSYNVSEWKDVEQRVHLTWTKCHLGGRRPWFRCPVRSNGTNCEKRVAKLYLGGDLFACRQCWRLAYATQQDSDRCFGLDKAQKIRMRLGGSGSVVEPFPPKPKGMHWRTYYRLYQAHHVAEGRWLTAMTAKLGKPPTGGRGRRAAVGSKVLRGRR